jgi:hypothetical protein
VFLVSSAWFLSKKSHRFKMASYQNRVFGKCIRIVLQLCFISICDGHFLIVNMTFFLLSMFLGRINFYWKTGRLIIYFVFFFLKKTLQLVGNKLECPASPPVGRRMSKSGHLTTLLTVFCQWSNLYIVEIYPVLSLIDVTYKLICKVPFDFNQ